AVDDFGTGYSALSYLREFPVNTLKIDRSFVHEIATKNSDRRLVEAIVVMSHGLGLVVVAEGVETAEQDALLRELQCDLVQGNFYSSPIEAEDIFELLSDGATRQLLQVQAAR
ncbi:MAG: EAL domain-containing protein, partial [Gammaproteobacteria bacterium]